MNKTELAVINLSKHPLESLDDCVKLYNTAIITLQPKYVFSSFDSAAVSPTLIKNVRLNTRKNRAVSKLLTESFSRFAELNELDTYKRYLIWWVYTVYIPKQLYKYKPLDVLNDTLMGRYLEFVKLLSENIAIVNSFNTSCKSVVSVSLQASRSIEAVMTYLVSRDKLAAMHMAGNISSHALAAIPNDVRETYTFRQRSNPFTAQLFESIDKNRDYLMGTLNGACKNLIQTPVDFIAQCEYILSQKQNTAE